MRSTVLPDWRHLYAAPPFNWNMPIHTTRSTQNATTTPAKRSIRHNLPLSAWASAFDQEELVPVAASPSRSLLDLRCLGRHPGADSRNYHSSSTPLAGEHGDSTQDPCGSPLVHGVHRVSLALARLLHVIGSRRPSARTLRLCPTRSPIHPRRLIQAAAVAGARAQG